MSFKGLKMLKIPKLPDFEKYWKSSKNIQRGDPWKKNFFSFLFNTLFYTRQSYKTIRMSFGGLRMLKSPKLTQCYSFASVAVYHFLHIFVSVPEVSSQLRTEPAGLPVPRGAGALTDDWLSNTRWHWVILRRCASRGRTRPARRWTRMVTPHTAQGECTE